MKISDFTAYHEASKANIAACEQRGVVLTDAEKNYICLLVGKIQRYLREAK